MHFPLLILVLRTAFFAIAYAEYSHQSFLSIFLSTILSFVPLEDYVIFLLERLLPYHGAFLRKVAPDELP